MTANEEPTQEIDLGLLEFDELQPEEGPAKRVERTRATLAYALLGLLSGALSALILLLAVHTITADDFLKLTSAALSPLIGLLGAATGYYYGRSE